MIIIFRHGVSLLYMTYIYLESNPLLDEFVLKELRLLLISLEYSYSGEGMHVHTATIVIFEQRQSFTIID